MRKIALAFCLTFTASVSFANNIDVGKLNSQFKNLLAPFQNQNTIADVTFNDLNLSDDRVDKVGLSAQYYKKGSTNTLNLKLDNLQYDYNNGISPKTFIAGSLGIDLTKLLPQEEINEIVPGVVEYIDELLEMSSDEDYGDALDFNGAVTSATKDSSGNYTGFSALFAANIDLNKLPQSTPVEEVAIKGAALSVSLNVKEGIHFHGYFISNPDYKSFKEDEEGLTELLQKLVANDPEEMQQIFQVFVMVDAFVTAMLEDEDVLGKYLSFSKSRLKK